MKSNGLVLRALCTALGMCLLAPLTSGAAEPVATPSLAKAGNRARDCVGDAILDARRRERIRFVVWCSIQSGKIHFGLRRPIAGTKRTAPIAGFTAHAETTGPGAGRAVRCHRKARTVQCRGRKGGPIVVRGSIAVAQGTRCATAVWLSTAFATSVGRPAGCPGSPHRPQRIRFGYMRSFRAQFDLDWDLDGDRNAIERRIRAIARAYRRGEPVARYAMAEVGQPLRAADMRRLDFRDELLERTADALERWVPLHAADSYAGYHFDDRWPVTFYVGFTGDQEAQLAAFKSWARLFAPDHVKPFPVPPRYSENELGEFLDILLEDRDSALARLVNSLSIDSFGNVVEVGTEHVAKVRRLLAERFGADAPFRVIHQAPAVFG